VLDESGNYKTWGEVSRMPKIVACHSEQSEESGPFACPFALLRASAQNDKIDNLCKEKLKKEVA
jgi:hypothetical protein